jgi:hypothetical protein
MVADQEFVALDDLAAAFQLTVHEESLGAITVTYKGKTIVLTPEQALASVAGRLVSLPAPPSRSGRRWLVPVEFISRALTLVYDARLDLRKPSRLLVVGDLRVPRILVRYDSLGAGGRLTIDATPRANSTVTQEGERILVKFDADALDAPSPLLPPQTLQAAPPSCATSASSTTPPSRSIPARGSADSEPPRSLRTPPRGWSSISSAAQTDTTPAPPVPPATAAAAGGAARADAARVGDPDDRDRSRPRRRRRRACAARRGRRKRIWRSPSRAASRA